jgi:hypothetical protein
MQYYTDVCALAITITHGSAVKLVSPLRFEVYGAGILDLLNQSAVCVAHFIGISQRSVPKVGPSLFGATYLKRWGDEDVVDHSAEGPLVATRSVTEPEFLMPFRA